MNLSIFEIRDKWPEYRFIRVRDIRPWFRGHITLKNNSLRLSFDKFDDGVGLTVMLTLIIVDLRIAKWKPRIVWWTKDGHGQI